MVKSVHLQWEEPETGSYTDHWDLNESDWDEVESAIEWVKTGEEIYGEKCPIFEKHAIGR
jgi:hypothetical protein